MSYVKSNYSLQLNSGVTTQLLLTLFDIKGIVHFGIAGNANPDLQIGDVTVPRYWAHTGLWNWQVKLPEENFGDLITNSQ